MMPRESVSSDVAFEESILRTRCEIDTDYLSLTQSTSKGIILVTFNAFVNAISADLSAYLLMTQRSALRSGSANAAARVLN